MVIDFEGVQMKPLLYGLICQTLLPFNNATMGIKEGDRFEISFNNDVLKGYVLLVTNVSITSLGRVTNKDISRNGFVYKPAFLNFMKKSKNLEEDSSIVKLDFKLVEDN